jgi:hypothetical protein
MSRLRPLSRPVVLLACLGGASSAHGQAVVLEIFKSDVEEMASFEPTGFALELQGKPFTTLGRVALSLGVRASFDDGESLWLGAGVLADAQIGSGPWVVEGSVMPGYYDPGSSEFDLGSSLEVHSSIGLGYDLNDRSRISLVASHLSNAGTADRNPGRNAVALRLRRGF